MAHDSMTKHDTGRTLEPASADLLLAVACALITLAVSLISFSTALSAVFGIGMVLFLPGYGLIAMLFPGRNDIGLFERAALSMGMSLMTAALTGLALYLSPLGFASDKLFVCLALLTVACAVIAYKRRQGLDQEGRFRFDTGEAYRKIATFSTGDGRLNQAIIIVLALAIIASILAISYAIMVPVHGEPFTEFYLLGPDGRAGDYPLKFHTGDTGSLIVGVTSHEYRDVTYDLVVSLNDSVNTSRMYEESMTLASGETWEKRIEIKPDLVGMHEKLEFLLYADGNYTAPYRDLHLQVDVLTPLY
jgi:uncharacterized membrane protein